MDYDSKIICNFLYNKTRMEKLQSLPCLMITKIQILWRLFFIPLFHIHVWLFQMTKIILAVFTGNVLVKVHVRVIGCHIQFSIMNIGSLFPCECTMHPSLLCTRTPTMNTNELSIPSKLWQINTIYPSYLRHACGVDQRTVHCSRYQHEPLKMTHFLRLRDWSR